MSNSPLQVFRNVPFAISLVAYAGFLGGLWSLYLTGSPKSLKVTVYDQIARPGEKVALAVKLERDGPGLLNPDLRGQEVVLVLAGAPEPRRFTVVTDSDGTAHAQAEAPSEPGLYPLTVELGARFSARPHLSAGLTVFDPGRPIVVCDIDDTVTLGEKGEEAKLFVPGAGPKAAPGAAAELERLTKRYNLVFLTARDDALLDGTRRWLQEKGFPRAPVVGRDWHVLSPLTTGDDKQKTLQEWRRRLGPIAWGIGNSAGDRAAYATSGIDHIMIGERSSGPTKKDGVTAFEARNWTEIGQIIRKAEEGRK